MDIHDFFGLSYSTHLTIDPECTKAGSAGDLEHLRTLTRQLWDAYPQFADIERVALVGELREMGDLTEAEMLRWGVTTNRDFVHDHCDCGPEPTVDDGASDLEYEVLLDDWQDARWDHEREAQRWTYQGEEYDRDEREVFPEETLEQARDARRQVIPRTLLQSMPSGWQYDLVATLERCGAAGDLKVYALEFFDLNGQRIGEPVPEYSRGRTFIAPRPEPAL